MAGISIATLTGENGIITTAIKAEEKTEKAEIEEQFRLAQLSCKINNEGGAITVDEWLEEIERQEVDFTVDDIGETMLHMTVKGKYLYEIRWVNGEIEFEDQGTTSKPKPKIVSIDIMDQTDDKITLQVSTLRNEGGNLKCYIKENDEYTFVAEQKEGNNTFEINIDPDKIYSHIKIEAIAKNGETASKEEQLTKVPSLEEAGAVTLSYHVDGKVISEDDWTKGPITVTAKVNNIDTTGYTLQYATTKEPKKEDWKVYPTAGVELEKNATIHLQLKDSKGKTGKKYAKEITKIDTKAPKNFTPIVTDVNEKTKSITVKGKTTDVKEDNGTDGSGVVKYYFGIEEGDGKPENWEPKWEPTEGMVATKVQTEGQAEAISATEGKTEETEASYTFGETGLEYNKTYSIRVKAVDQVGNETKSAIMKTVLGGTENIGMGGLVPSQIPSESEEIKIDYELANWTNGDVIIALTNMTGDNSYELQYKCKTQSKKEDGTIEWNWSEWKNYDDTQKVKFESNGVIVARLIDSTNGETKGNIKAIATGNITKIDKTKPTITSFKVATDHTTGDSKTTTNSITLELEAKDENSGLSKIEWYYKKENETSYKKATGDTTYTVDSKTGIGQQDATGNNKVIKTITGLDSGINYDVYAQICDVAGNGTGNKEEDLIKSNVIRVAPDFEMVKDGIWKFSDLCRAINYWKNGSRSTTDTIANRTSN